MTIDYLNLTLRFFHIFAAMVAGGGIVIWRFVLLPDLHVPQDESRKELKEKLRKRWAMIVGMCILVLLITGLVNYIMFVKSFKNLDEAWRDTYAMTYHILFGIKFLLAFVLFFIASALSGKAVGLQKMRDNAKFWLNVNLLLVIAITLIGGIMRQSHSAPTPPPGKVIEYRAAENTTTQQNPEQK